MIVEIRAAEGGDDAKDLVLEQTAIYGKLLARRGLSFEIIDNRPGMLIFQVTGREAEALFKNEPGGHRWQRVPPTERSGRVHTSTITVAVLPEPTKAQVHLKDSDLEWKTCRGSGAGGQHRNVTDSAVLLKHKPSGLVVRCESERSQFQNKASARAVLASRLWAAELQKISGGRAADRKTQVGSGMRGDKRRTVRSKDGQVNDHVTGRYWDYKKYIRGDWD